MARVAKEARSKQTPRQAKARQAKAQPVREKKPKEPTPYERVKLAVAEDLGLGEKVREVGWAGLTAAETGRIGGLITRRLKQMGLMLGPGGTLLPLQVQGPIVRPQA